MIYGIKFKNDLNASIDPNNKLTTQTNKQLFNKTKFFKLLIFKGAHKSAIVSLELYACTHTYVDTYIHIIHT